ASVNAPVLDVSLPNGAPIATAVSFASTTPYQVVAPGTWTLAFKPNGTSSVTTLACTLAAGSVYSLLVLDGKDGLKLELRVDARGGGEVPDGGVETCAGGVRPDETVPFAMVGGGVVVLACLLLVALRLRRLAAARRP